MALHLDAADGSRMRACVIREAAMWIRKRRHKDSIDIDIDEIKELRGRSPAKTWVNLLLLDMSRDSVNTYTLKQSQGIPPVAHEEDLPEGEISFERIINRLKVMAGLDPIRFTEPKKGSLSISVSGNWFTFNTIFIDSSDNPQCSITMFEKKA